MSQRRRTLFCKREAETAFPPPSRGRDRERGRSLFENAILAGMNTGRARALRATMTDAERVLWRALRRKQLDAMRFRRQQPIGPYVADLYCAAARLVVEVDGGQHAEGADATRDAWLAALGYGVLRFWNNDVLGNIEGVIETIRVVVAGRAGPS